METASREVPSASPEVAWTPATPTVGSGGSGVAACVAAFTSVTLTAEQLAHVRPNKLGRIPILMYHGFTTNPDKLDDWTVSPRRCAART